MDIRQFSDVHPNWYVIRTLDADEIKALLDLCLTLMAVGSKFTPEQRSAFVHALLDDRGSNLSPETVQVMVWSAEDRLAQCDDKQLGKRLGEAAKTIKDDVKRIAAFRLLAIVGMAQGSSVTTLNLCQALGRGLGIDDQTSDNILRAAWESRQAALNGRAPMRARERRAEQRSLDQRYAAAGE